MFWQIFFAVLTICIGVYLALYNFAASRASGPGEPINWFLLIAISSIIAVIFSSSVIGLVSLLGV